MAGNVSNVVSAGIRVTYEPILDVARGVCAGFRVQAKASPTVDAMTGTLNDRTGMFTAAVVVAALESARTRPPNTFVMIPIGVKVAASRPVRSALGGFGDLRGVVLDMCGDPADVPVDGLEAALLQYRDNGALIAVGGKGGSQPELSGIVRLKPSILRLGRDWVRGIERYDAKRGAIEVVGQLASQLDAWVLAEGVTSAAELSVLNRLGVPLALGPFVGEPSSSWPAIRDDAARGPAISGCDPAGAGVVATAVAVGTLAQPAHTTADPVPALDDHADLVVVLDDHGRPTSLLARVGTGWETVSAMTVNTETPVSEAVVRAMTRPRLARFTPLVCTDEAGRFAGVVRIERLMAHLTRRRPESSDVQGRDISGAPSAG